MQVQVRIKTPPGHASKTEPMLRKMLLGMFRKPTITAVNQEESELTWTLDCTLTQAMGLQRNAFMFEKLAGNTMEAWAVKKYIKRELKKEGKDVDEGFGELKALFSQTKIEILNLPRNPSEPPAAP